MSNRPNDERAHEQPPVRSAVVLLLSDVANTTWRMFVPTLGLLLLGRWIDARFGLAPYAVLVGAVLGFALAIVLIIKQVKDVS